jgi:hypothetical protein
MTLAVPTVVTVPRAAFDLYAEPAPTTQRRAADAEPDIVEEWGLQSFPASDPPANW